MFTHKGKIKFFDKRKNNFGFITDIISQNGAIEADIYFSGNDIICPKKKKRWESSGFAHATNVHFKATLELVLLSELLSVPLNSFYVSLH